MPRIVATKPFRLHGKPIAEGDVINPSALLANIIVSKGLGERVGHMDETEKAKNAAVEKAQRRAALPQKDEAPKKPEAKEAATADDGTEEKAPAKTKRKYTRKAKADAASK